MQINIEEGEPSQESFFFEPAPLPLLQQKQAKEVLTKWGLADTLRIASFRYNQHLNDYEAPRFLHDLFNNPNVRYVLNNVKFNQAAIATVEFERLRCHELTTEMFDQLQKEEIVRKGYISKMMPDYYEEIEICDKLRECLVVEDSEGFCIFNEAQRNQLLFRLFRLLVIGGSFNQYEDLIHPYLQWTKKLYKTLVAVRKRPQTNEVFVQSLFWQIKSMDGGKSFKKGLHPQQVLYVVVNPSLRTVHVLANDWKKYW